MGEVKGRNGRDGARPSPLRDRKMGGSRSVVTAGPARTTTGIRPPTSLFLGRGVQTERLLSSPCRALPSLRGSAFGRGRLSVVGRRMSAIGRPFVSERG